MSNYALKDSVQNQFNQAASNYSTSPIHAAGRDLALMISAANLNGNEHVLDAGTGTGHTALTFAPHVAQVVAYDLAESMLAQGQRLATERAITNIEFRKGDVEKLPFADASFDLVTTRYSAHHWPNPLAALHEFRRVLRPNGRLLVDDIVSWDDFTLDTHLQTIELLRDPSHVRDHTISQWQAMMSLAGFQSEVIATWDVEIEYTSWIQRINTPVQHAAMIRTLLAEAPSEVKTQLRVQADSSFTLQGALITAASLNHRNVPKMTVRFATKREEFFAGLRGVLPLIIGAIPFAIIFGAVAVTNGLSPLATAAMSAFVYAGSAQFIAADMVGAGVGNWVIIFTTFIVNLRHLLYAATLAPHMKALRQRWLIPLGFSLTDESFVVAVQRYNKDDGSPIKHWYHLGTAVPMYINWQFFTWVGIFAGRYIPNIASWGLDFAFPATFIGMLVPLVVNSSIAASVVCASIAAIVFYSLPNHLGLIVAALIGVAAGMIVEHWFPSTAPTTIEQTPGSSRKEMGNS